MIVRKHPKLEKRVANRQAETSPTIGKKRLRLDAKAAKRATVAGVNN